VRVRAVFDQVQSSNNSQRGMLFDGNSSTGRILVTVESSVSADNAGIGIDATSSAGQALVRVLVVGSVSSTNARGFNADIGGSVIAVGASSVGMNGTAASGAVASFGDNYSFANAVSDAFPLSISTE